MARLDFVPLADSTEVKLASNWPHPSFVGAWMPDERSIGAEGFTSTWRTTRHSSGGTAYWKQHARTGRAMESDLATGVAFFDPVNIYALTYRATEYAFLVVLFTFGGIALMEAAAGVRLHLVQYALVGSALAVFFLLLLALSEHVAFDTAYLAAASACLALLGAYLRHPLGSSRRAGVFACFGAALYGALFVLLKSEDHALLLGSLMVFALLALAMLGTRKVDWNDVGARLRSPIRRGEVGDV